MRKHLAVIVAATLAVLASGVGAESAQITLRAAHTNAAGEPQDEGLKMMQKRLEELTGGKATIEIFPNGVLGHEVAAIEGVLLGTIDMTVPANAPFTNFVPEFKLFDMPFLFRDMAHMDKVVSGPVFEELRTPAQKKGFRLLAIFSSGIRHIMTKEPIRSIDDLKGRKIRTMQNPVHLEAFKAFGANPTPLAYSELYSALQAGVVDGAEAANTNYSAQKFYEVSRHWALVGWLNLTAPVVISERRFTALPPDVQAALTRAAQEAAVSERKLVVDTDRPLLEKIKAQGVTITTPDPEPFRRAAAKVYDKFLTSETDKRLLKMIQETN